MQGYGKLEVHMGTMDTPYYGLVWALDGYEQGPKITTTREK